MKVIDPGHCYILDTLDKDVSPAGYICDQLAFVKRIGEKYPGNDRAYPGTTIQDVCRALIDRLKYVNNQERCGETEVCITYARKIIVELESRAAKRHGRKVHLSFDVENMPTCKLCGHIGCNETCRPKIKSSEPQSDSPMATGDGLTT